MIDLDKTIGKLRLSQSQHFIETYSQTLFGALVQRVALTETMNHRAFQSRRQICRRLGRFGVVPHRHLIRGRQLQDAIEIVLTRAALVVDQLRDTEAVNRVAALRAERFYERKRLIQRVGRMNTRLRWRVRFGLKFFAVRRRGSSSVAIAHRPRDRSRHSRGGRPIRVTARSI